MSAWRDLGPLAAFPDGDMRPVEVGSWPLIVVRRGEAVYAYEDRCTHIDFPLSTGVIDDGEIVCSWHGACFQIETGNPTCPPAEGPLTRFETRVDNGRVLVKIGDNSS